MPCCSGPRWTRPFGPSASRSTGRPAGPSFELHRPRRPGPRHALRSRGAHGVERTGRVGRRQRAGNPGAGGRRGPVRRPGLHRAHVGLGDGGRHPGRERRLQRQPDLDGRRAAGRAVDGGRRPVHRRAGGHGRARAGVGRGARAGRRARGEAQGRRAGRGRAPAPRLIAVGAEREGVEPDASTAATTSKRLRRLVRRLARPGDLVLVKASRVERLERVADALAEADPVGPLGQEAAA